MTEPISRSAVRGVLFLGSSKAVNTLVRFGVLAVLARLLTPSDFGVVAAALIVAGLAETVLMRGLVPSLIQRPVLETRHLESMFAAGLVFGSAGTIIIFLVAPAAAGLFDIDEVEPVLQVLSLLFLINGAGVVSNSQLRRDLAFGYLAKAEIVSYALGYGAVGMIAGLAGWGVWALVAANLGRRAVYVTMLVLKRPPPFPPRIDRAALRDLLPLAWGYSVGSIGSYAAQQADNYVVAMSLGPAALGVYGRAFQLMAEPVNRFGQILGDVLFPTMAKVQAEPRRLGDGYISGSRIIALIILPISLVFAILGEEVVGVVLGDQWTAAVTPFRVLALGMVLRASYRISDTVARATGAVYRRAWRSWVFAGMVTSGALIGQNWGLNGVATAVLIAMFANFVLVTGLALRLAGVSWARFLRSHMAVGSVSLLVLLVAWPLAEVLRASGAPDLATLAGTISVSAIAALGAAWRLPRIFSVPDVGRLLRMVRSR